MRASVLLVVSAAVLPAQTWTSLGSGTQLDPIKPQDCNNTGSPSYCNGVIYPYASNFFSIITPWSGGVARTKAGSEQFLIFGGGHNAYFGNQVVSVNLTNNTVSALTTPSLPHGTGSPVTVSNIDCALNADGTPRGVHSYGQVVYLPTADRMFFWDSGSNTYCGGSASVAPTNYVYYFDPNTNTWSIKNNAGTTPLNGAAFSTCALDTSFAITAHESVICMVTFAGTARSLARFDTITNTWTQLLSYNNYSTLGYSTSVAIDPVRRIMIVAGLSGNATGSMQISTIDISTSSYTITGVTSLTTGCSAVGVAWPGIAYDSLSSLNFLIWPNAGNTVYEYDPTSKTCTAHSPSGGPPAEPNPNSGTFGRFGLFPSLSKIVVVNATTNNAYAYDPGTPPHITTPASAGAITAGTQNSAYTYTFVASGTTPLTWSITSGAPPTGVSLNSSSGVLSGTPTTSGTYSFTVSVTNGYGSPATVAVSLTVAAVCLISSTTMASGKFNVPYSQTVPTAGCTSPTFAVTAGALPTGLSLNTGTGAITGTPSVSGLFSFTIGVTDAAGSPSQALTVTIIPGPGVFGVLAFPGLVYR